MICLNYILGLSEDLWFSDPFSFSSMGEWMVLTMGRATISSSFTIFWQLRKQYSMRRNQMLVTCKTGHHLLP